MSKKEGKSSDMNTETIIVLRSVTHSLKAIKVLAASGINARAARAPSQSVKGCAYGIALASTLADKARTVLNANKLPIVNIIKSS